MRTHTRALNYIKQNGSTKSSGTFTPAQRRRLVKKAWLDPDAHVTKLGPNEGLPARRGERHLRWAA